MDQLKLNYVCRRKRMLRRHVGVSEEEMRHCMTDACKIQ